MKEKLYNLLSEFNDILKDIDDVERVLEIQFNGITEGCDKEMARSVLNVHLRLIKAIRKDSEELYNKIDQTILDMKYERI